MRSRIIGMRTIKTAISLGICMLVYILFKGFDILIKIDGVGLYYRDKGFRFSDFYSPFFAGIGAAYSLYPSKKQSISQAKNRIVASLLGGIIGIVLTIGYGLIGYVSDNDFFVWPNLGDTYKLRQYILPYTLIMLVSILVVVIGNMINKKAAIFVGILTFISVTINPMGMIVSRYNKTLPFLGEAVFGTNRILSTIIGVSISLGVNLFRIPHKTKNKNLLFVVGIEGMLNDDYDTIKGYMNYKLNRVTEDGINTTLFTTRIPSTFMYLLDTVKINHPVVCMSGAALYDTVNKRYIYTECIPSNVSLSIDQIFSELDIHPFKNFIIDNVLYTYIDKLDNIGAQAFYEAKKNAEYSNMILHAAPEGNDVLHYLLCVENDKVDEIISALNNSSIKDEILIQIYDAFMNNKKLQHLKYIKVYSREILKLNVLKKYTNYNNFKTVGLTTSKMADHLLENSDIKLSCSNTEIAGVKHLKDYDAMFKEIEKIYYSDKIKREMLTK